MRKNKKSEQKIFPLFYRFVQKNGMVQKMVLHDLSPSITRTTTPTTSSFQFGLDKSSPYKNGGFLPLFNTFTFEPWQKNLLIPFLVFIFAISINACFTGKSKVTAWPPEDDKILKNIYPYDFDKNYTASLESLKKIIAGGKYQKKHEEIYLFAYGRGLLDALLYDILQESSKQKSFSETFSNLLEIQGDGSFDNLMTNASVILEPFLILTRKHKHSRYREALFEAKQILQVISPNTAPEKILEEKSNYLHKKTDKNLLLAYQRNCAFAIRIFDAFKEAFNASPEMRTNIIIKKLLPLASMETPRNSQKDSLEFTLTWIKNIFNSVLNDEDILASEIKHILISEKEKFFSLPLIIQPETKFDLPEFSTKKKYSEYYYPYAFLIVGKDGSIRIAQEPILEIDKKEKFPIKNSNSEFIWPGKSTLRAQLLDELQKAQNEIAKFIPPKHYLSAQKGKIVALVAEKNTPVSDLLEIIQTLKRRYTKIFIAFNNKKEGITNFFPVRIDPACITEGERVTILLDKNLLKITKIGEEGNQSIKFEAESGKEKIEANRVSTALKNLVNLNESILSIDIKYNGGNWTWNDLAKLAIEILENVSNNPSLYLYLLPEISIEELAQIMEKGKLEISGNPQGESIENFILKGTSPQIEESELDEKLSSYVSGVDLTEAAHVVLQAARCWGGSFRERAGVALSKSDSEILQWISDFIGEEAIGDIVSQSFIQAGKNGTAIVAQKFESPDETIWTSAWNILKEIGYENSAEEIEKLLSNPDAEIRIRALKLLSQIGPAGGIPKILELIDDPDEGVRRWAIACAGMLGMKDAKDKLISILNNRYSTKGIISDAIFSLGLLEEHSAIDKILSFSSNPDSEIRSSVALSLGNMGIKRDDIKETLLRLLKDNDNGVILNALKALSNYRDPETINDILPFLKSNDSAIRDAAEEAKDAIEEM